MIKKMLSLGFAAAISFASFAQTTAAANIPVQVSNAFQSQNPSVTNVIWNQEAGYFLPTFTKNQIDIVGYIDLKGHYIQTISKIAVADLPSAATTYISQNYHGGQISEVGKIEFPNNNPVRYYVKVSGKQLLFNNTGTFIKVTESFLKQ